MTNTNNNPTYSSTILPFQKPVFDQLTAVAKACLFIDRKQFKESISPRCHFIILGSSGSGKTHLSRTIAQELEVPIFAISVSDWIVLGNSSGGSNNTWPLLVQFIADNLDQDGVIIFIDELDKCGDDSSWNTYLRTEIFSLCDARVPVGVKDPDSENDKFDDHVITKVQEFLKYKTMIIGGAAFQSIWDKQSSASMGFNPDDSIVADEPVLSDLASYLPRELINRFSSKLFILPQPNKQDYHNMITAIAPKIQDTWREQFVTIGMANIDVAVRDKKGVRYLEETILSAMVEVRGGLLKPPSRKEAPCKEGHTVDGIEFKHNDVINIF